MLSLCPSVEVFEVNESAVLSSGPLAIRIRHAIVQLREERLLRRMYDYAWLKVAMDSDDDLPSFESAQKYIDYLGGELQLDGLPSQKYIDYLGGELQLDGLPSESSVSKMMDAARGQLFNWTFSDTSDAQETTRRNNIVKRFFNLMRGRI